MFKIQQSFTVLSPIFPPKTIMYGLLNVREWPYLLPGVCPETLITFHIPTFYFKSRWNKSSDARPPEPVAPPYMITLLGSTQTAPCAARADGEFPVPK